MAAGEFGEWGTPGSGRMNFIGLSILFKWKPSHTRAPIIVTFYNGGDAPANVTLADWQALLDHLASMPGAIEAVLMDGLPVERSMSASVDYEPLPPPPNDA